MPKLTITRTQYLTELNQLRELRQAADRLGWIVAGEFVDRGISGAKGRKDRPQLDALLKGVARKGLRRRRRVVGGPPRPLAGGRAPHPHASRAGPRHAEGRQAGRLRCLGGAASGGGVGRCTLALGRSRPKREDGVMYFLKSVEEALKRGELSVDLLNVVGAPRQLGLESDQRPDSTHRRVRRRDQARGGLLPT